MPYFDMPYHLGHLRYHAPNLMAVLKDRGYRSTARRKAIAKLLEQKQGGFTTKVLCEELPWVGRAIVFRTIKLLVEAAAVCKLSKMDGASVYSLARVGDRHHRSVCVRCRAVGEFKAATIDESVRAIAADIPGQIVDHRIELYVACLHETCDYGLVDGGT